MGILIRLNDVRSVVGTDDPRDDRLAGPRDIPIGELIKSLSVPSRLGETMPFRRGDASILFEHLLKFRDAAFWDKEACARVRREILTLMTASLADKRAYAERRLDEVGNRQFAIGYRAAEAWVVRPLEAFTAAIRAACDARREYLNDNRLAFLRASFLVCLFEANAPSGPAVVPRPFVPHAPAHGSAIPFSRPRR